MILATVMALNTLMSMLALAEGTTTSSTSNYIVQPGDTLSEIIWQKYGNPIYGEGHFLDQVKKKNELKNPNKIYPGQEIQLLPSQFFETPPSEVATPAAKPEELPVPSVVSEESVALLSFWKIGFTPRNIFSKIEGTDTQTGGKAKLLSDLGVGSSFFAEKTLVNNWHYSFNFDYSRLKFMAPSNKSISQESRNLMGVFVGGAYDFSKRVRLNTLLGIQQELFLKDASSSNVILEKEEVPRARVGLEIEVMRQEKFKALLQLNGDYRFSKKTNTYNINSSTDYYGKISIVRLSNSDLELRGGIFYGHNGQSTSVVDQERTDIGADVGLTWRLR